MKQKTKTQRYVLYLLLFCSVLTLSSCGGRAAKIKELITKVKMLLDGSKEDSKETAKPIVKELNRDSLLYEINENHEGNGWYSGQ